MARRIVPAPLGVRVKAECKVAALFAAAGGTYSRITGVDVWDKVRDARLYKGPYPVVCHPPCQLWGALAKLNFKRYGGEHNRPGNDSGCFAFALSAVRTWGGVLEHPALSYAFASHSLTKPLRDSWQFAGRANEWVTECSQSAYGHRARKRTWLIYVGQRTPPEIDWSDPPGTHQCGWFDRIKPTLGRVEASATPPAFRDLLLSLARHSRAT